MKIGIVTLAFGMPATIEANKLLAQITEKCSKKNNAPIFSQGDVNFSKEFEVTRVKEANNKPAPTLRIARAAITWAEKNNIKTLLVIAAPLHEWRVKRDFHKAVKEINSIVVIRMSEEVKKHSLDIWLCRDSKQIHTKYKITWEIREFIIRIMPFWFYRVIAS